MIRMDGRLKTAAEEGNINTLYDLIRENSKVLDDIDEVPFIETPLHIAASNGKISFAMEIVRLKPSFSRKLNEDGFSPMHQALFNGQKKMVERFVDHERDLARVQGKEGKTPLHHAAEQGEVYLLVKFLLACPASIQDVTVHGETALHIAVKNRKVEAVDVLLGGLLTACHEGSNIQQKVILNRKDVQGKTALHIAIATNQVQVVRLLVKSGIDVNAKDEEGQTALDILNPQNKREVEEILLRAKALNNTCLFFKNYIVGPDHDARYCLMSKLSFRNRLRISMIRTNRNIENNSRNMILVVATLILTATYQATLSPPGGLWQDDSRCNSNNNNIQKIPHNIAVNCTTTSISNTTTYICYNNYNDGGNTTSESETHTAGTIIMSTHNFINFYVANGIVLLVVLAVFTFLLPSGPVGWLVRIALVLYSYCYVFSLKVISPADQFRDLSVRTIICYLVMVCISLLPSFSLKFEKITSS